MAESDKGLLCVYCQEFTDVRISCAVCPDFDLCPQCFACGAKIGSHENFHDYKIIGSAVKGPEVSYLYPGQKTWRFEEEIELLENLKRYGYGAWETVANLMGTKSAEEVEEHYIEMFVEGNIGKVTWSNLSTPEIMDHTEPVTYEKPIEEKVEEKEEQEKEGNNEGEKDVKKEVDIKKEVDAKKEIEEADMNKEIYKTIGYKPLRDDYEEEYDNDAEDDIKFQDGSEKEKDDDDLQTPLKLACIDMYQNRLRTRHRVKNIVKEYDLITEFELSENSKPSQSIKDKSKEESVLRNQLKIFCRFITASECETFIKNMLKEQKLKSHIKELMAKFSKKNVTKSPSKSPNPRADSGKPKLYKTSKENKHKKSPSQVLSKTNTTPTRKEVRSPNTVSTCAKLKKKVSRQDSREKLSSMTGYDLLTKAEKRLCSDLDLEPTGYMALKLVLLKERNLNQESHKSVIVPGLNENEVQKVNDYLSCSGWIPSS